MYTRSIHSIPAQSASYSTGIYTILYSRCTPMYHSMHLLQYTGKYGATRKKNYVTNRTRKQKLFSELADPRQRTVRLILSAVYLVYWRLSNDSLQLRALHNRSAGHVQAINQPVKSKQATRHSKTTSDGTFLDTVGSHHIPDHSPGMYMVDG